MPIYEYRCEACCQVKEALFRQNEKPERIVCDECGAGAERILSSFSIEGAAPKTSNASLAASSNDFATNQDTFVKAMDTFGEKVSNPLTKQEKERAVERLRNT